MYLVLDTETTGVKGDVRLVQLAWQGFNAQRVQVALQNTLIRPAGFRIPPDATAVHGITTEYALQWGMGLAEALEQLSAEIANPLGPAHVLVGHNLTYDLRVLEGEYRRLHLPSPFDGLPRLDTMLTTVELCAIPRDMGGWKWPKLQELYFVLFDEDFPAHDAGADVAACARCLWELQDRRVIELPVGSQAVAA